ncbi:MAG: FHA domain-containing protein [Pirellulaceae bacterium]
MHFQLTLQNQVDGLTCRVWNFTVPAVVGREPGVDICIEHDSISRKHCQFSQNFEGALVIKDLQSMNGTYVNDSRIQQKALTPGETIQIGSLRLEIAFLSDDEKPTPTASMPKGNVYATQPMQTIRSTAPAPSQPIAEPWWRRWFR